MKNVSIVYTTQIIFHEIVKEGRYMVGAPVSAFTAAALAEASSSFVAPIEDMVLEKMGGEGEAKGKSQTNQCSRRKEIKF